MMAFASVRSPLARRVINYLVIFLIVFGSLNMLGWWGYLTYKNQMQPTMTIAPNPAGLLIEKVAYYKTHTGDYNALLLGDSRTLCGMHPDYIDPLWGKRSYNLSHWATWLPAQYALISDVAPIIPKDTVVVWSIGYQNFIRSPIRAVYPPGWARIIPMTLDGQSASELIAAQMAFTPVTALMGRRQEFLDQVTQFLDKPVRAAKAGPVSSSSESSLLKTDPVLEKVRENPLTAYTESWLDEHGALASIAQYKTNGAMTRIERIPAFYREKQREDEAGGSAVAEGFAADESLMRMFEKTLDMLQAQGLRVVISELEEAPYRYKSDTERKKFRDWMRTHIKPAVEKRGFIYIHADEVNLTNADYFDFNHLNETGAKRHNAVLARKLRQAAP